MAEGGHETRGRGGNGRDEGRAWGARARRNCIPGAEWERARKHVTEAVPLCAATGRAGLGGERARCAVRREWHSQIAEHGDALGATGAAGCCGRAMRDGWRPGRRTAEGGPSEWRGK
jgi:hypothetical protein